jgi:hypothetical protein
MSIRNRGFFLRAALSAAGFAVLLGACDQWSLFINSDGVLSISIVSDDLAQGRLRVRTRDADGLSQTLDVPSSGALTLGGLKAGELELTLLAPPGCRVAAPNPRTVVTEEDKTATVAFEVRCEGAA